MWVRPMRDKEPSSTFQPPITQKDSGIIRGNVTYPYGAVAGVAVTAGQKSAVSDKAGKYEISGLAPGVYEVTAIPSFPGVYEAQTLKVELAAGETKVVDMYLDFEKTVAEGHVYDLDGRPLAGAILSSVLCGKNMETSTTDEHGYFKFDRVTPGDRLIRANAPGRMGERREFKAIKGERATLDFHLAPASCKVHGTVTDKNGKPLQAEIMLLKSNQLIGKTESDAQSGYYELHLLPGAYTVVPRASGFESNGWEGSISDEAKVDFTLEPSRPLPPTGIHGHHGFPKEK